MNLLPNLLRSRLALHNLMELLHCQISYTAKSREALIENVSLICEILPGFWFCLLHWIVLLHPLLNTHQPNQVILLVSWMHAWYSLKAAICLFLSVDANTFCSLQIFLYPTTILCWAHHGALHIRRHFRANLVQTFQKYGSIVHWINPEILISFTRSLSISKNSTTLRFLCRYREVHITFPQCSSL